MNPAKDDYSLKLKLINCVGGLNIIKKFLKKEIKKLEILKDNFKEQNQILEQLNQN